MWVNIREERRKYQCIVVAQDQNKCQKGNIVQLLQCESKKERDPLKDQQFNPNAFVAKHFLQKALLMKWQPENENRMQLYLEKFCYGCHVLKKWPHRGGYMVTNVFQQ